MAQTPGFNPITKPTEGEKVPAGSTYKIVWEPSAANPGAITIGLLGGATPSSLNVIDTIAAAVDSAAGSFAWNVPATLGDLATYGIKISLDSDPENVFQYGFPFKIVGHAGSSTSASASGGPSHTATGSASGSASSVSHSATGSASDEPTTTKTSTSTVTSTSTKTSTKKHTKTVTPTTVTSTSASSTSVSTVRSSSSHTTSHVHSTITSSVTSQRPTSTTSSTSSVATNGVASFAPGSIAMLGGVAMAVLAL
ncbi:Ser-Thr-rich glycosyl-phosphatidyl-inositol-anchored membrane family-domain-containing protein [Dichotomopilus funicola]|uniref:Ser-Thr-rich glycosyl-phosphatidyl-inositol-anchored membrane family-domain-containing protein n=1 Tax=Dichotomopilus funicola TaxID=1934379 RepID=A0AAN6VD25_9PEZI|nr:Ser-Thr-rich glycosyl-phosphatidyl-inositol-anchored membrane family-domain-containing protein [Dichotomopilus funicola]